MKFDIFFMSSDTLVIHELLMYCISIADLTRQERDDIISVMSLVQGSFVPADEDLADDSPDYGDDDLLEIRKRLISCCPTLTDESLESK